MKRWKINLPVALLLLAILFVVVVRIRLLTIPLERDEGEFAYAGQLMLQGIPPYKLFYNMKLPGIYAAYAVVMGVFGQTDAGIHLGLLVVNVIAILLLYLLAKRFLDPAGASAAAASYAILSTSPMVLGCSAHATHFVVAAALAGLLLLLRAEDSGKPILFFGSGSLLGLAILMKQPGAMFAIFGFYLLLARAVQEKEPWRHHLWRIAVFSMGVAAPLVLTGVILWRAGVFERFWFWTVTYATQHAKQISWEGGRFLLADFLRPVFATADGLFWIVAAIGLVTLLLSRGELRKKHWLSGFLVASLAALSISNYFTSHYFVMLLPALCLLVGEALSVAMQWPKNQQGKWMALPVAVFALLWLSMVCKHWDVFFVLTPEQVCRQEYGRNPFIECQEIGLYLREHSRPEDTIAVVGSEPELYFYARRHSATGYIYMYDMTAKQPFAKAMQQEMIGQIESARPEYFIYVHNPISWDLRSDFKTSIGIAIMKWMPKFAQDYYEPAGLVLLKPVSEYYWGKNAMNQAEFRGSFISIFQRK